jgi:TBCC domain-containing protein 1
MTIATAPNTTPFPALQCASNKWKQPVELAKLEIPQVHHNSLSPTSPTGSGSSSVTAASGADDRAVSGSSGSGKTGDDTMQTPILLPASEFHVLFVPLESELARMRRQQQQQLQQQQIMSISLSGSGSIPLDDLALPYSESAESMSMSPDKLQQDLVSKPSNSSSTGGGGLESQYCRNLSDVLQLSPFRLPPEFERRALTKADRIRLLQQKMQTDLTPAKQASVEEELNRGFRDWLVTSGNLRQVLDLVHLERRGGV